MGVAKKLLLEVIFVTSYAHVSVYSEDERWIYVEEEEEAADLFILNHVYKGDLVVTHNIGLAATFLPKVISVLSPKGILYKEKDMDTALELSFLSAIAVVTEIMEKV